MDVQTGNFVLFLVLLLTLIVLAPLGVRLHNQAAYYHTQKLRDWMKHQENMRALELRKE